MKHLNVSGLQTLASEGANSLDPNLEQGLGRDIFKDGPSPELEAEWDRLDALEAEFWTAGDFRREQLLEEHGRELEALVLCESCKQVLPKRWPAKVEEPS